MARYSQKTAKTAHTFSLFYHLEFSGLIHKWPSYRMFFRHFYLLTSLYSLDWWYKVAILILNSLRQLEN